eukprot:8602-Amphidinium_carterae.5
MNGVDCLWTEIPKMGECLFDVSLHNLQQNDFTVHRLSLEEAAGCIKDIGSLRTETERERERAQRLS